MEQLPISASAESPRCLVVMYHYVIDAAHPFPRLKGIAFDRFREQVEELGRHFTFINLAEFGRYCRGEGSIPPRACALTFDDGLKEHARLVAPYLAQKGISATFHAITQTLESTRLPSVHKLQLLMADLGIQKLQGILNQFLSREEHELFRYDAEKAARISFYPYDTPDVRYFKYTLNFVLPGARREELVNLAFKTAFTSEEAAHGDLYCSAEDLRMMRGVGHDIGSHTHTHALLASLPEEEQRRELVHSKRVLDTILGDPIVSLSYPKGMEGGFTDLTMRLAEEAGYHFAVTAVRGVNQGVVPPFRVNRLDTNDISPSLWAS